MRRILLFVLLSMAFLFVFTCYHFIKYSDNNFHLIFCDVGQGDGILIRTPKGVDVIVDGGPRENSMTDCLTRHLPFWDRSIEAMFMTHPDSDHLTGLIGVLKTYNVKFFGTSEAPKGTAVFQELMDTLKQKSVPVHYIFDGDLLKTNDGFSLTTFWPTRAFITEMSLETNDYSLIQEVQYGKFNALLDGDSPSKYLDPVINGLRYLDVFKPPHHGSKTGIDAATFARLVPSFAVLSYGYHNRYHHPAPSTLEFLKRANIPYKDTLKGDVEIVADSKKWWVVK